MSGSLKALTPGAGGALVPANTTEIANQSEPTAVGVGLTKITNGVILPLEVGALHIVEKSLEALTGGRVVFPALAALPTPVALNRPLLLIPGLNMEASSMEPIAKHFASAAPGNATAIYSTKDGAFHRKDARNPAITSDKELKGIKPITMAFGNPQATVKEKAAQIEAALEAIYERYGQTIHVAAHSQGNEAFLVALLNRARAGKPAIIESFTDIGGVDNGTALGAVGAKIGGIAGVKESGAEVAFDGAVIKEIHDNMDLIRSQIRGTVHNVAYAGGPTMGSDGKFGIGDGFTTVKDQGMPWGDKEVLTVPDPTPTLHLVEVALPGSVAAVQATIVKDEARISGDR
ncbi:MAG: hypothetical protein U1E65_18895 [Myxococcota bacterium]